MLGVQDFSIASRLFDGQDGKLKPPRRSLPWNAGTNEVAIAAEMNENSLELYDPTAANLAAVWKCGAPESDNATLECCLFCVASYHFGRDALRVTVDGANDIGPKTECQAGFRRVIQTLGTGGDTEGMAGTTEDERQELFFLVTRCTFATLSKTGRSCRHGASLIRPVFKEEAIGQ